MDRVEQQEQWLDSLLENPAPVADRGFTRALRSRLQHQARIRRLVFAGTALGWLALVLLVVPVDAVSGDFQQLLVLGSKFRELVSAVSALDISRDTLGTVNLLPAVAMALAVFALINLQLKR